MRPTIRAEIMTIGDEILFGQITDTNTQWIGSELTSIGIRPIRKTSVGDNADHILSALREASQRADLVLITGGLGPTKDDITKHTLCRYFDTELIINEDALELITGFFAKRGRAMTELNRMQAALPANCTYLENRWGTAPGMWFEKEGTLYISMPGVPYEMKNLMEHVVLPRLKAYFNPPVILHKVIHTVGIGESFLAERIESWEDSLPPHIRLAYLPHLGQVRLRLTATGTDRSQLEKELAHEVERVLPIIGHHVFGYDNDVLEQVVGQLLVSRGATLSTAESCSGGYIAHLLTSIPGSSRYFMGSVISYDNAVKIRTLGVKEETIRENGAVSEQTVTEMAERVRELLGTTYGIATSGIAGPDGGTDEKPVGTVWIACSTPTQTITKLLTLGGSRVQNIQLTAIHALNLLREQLVKTDEQPVLLHQQ
ncbi:competence/damage-inducible protein A [Telluribacter sp. SYSU D00476]|uniref:competence/damage-inducible protein A n=1 Tax=Telluribacter sp. SYSU D00476 TaxID=2811430 RepID=UPI001FF15F67|nr:competence/damage-inducible protein A [Telluribacter sp. SYSU D00476]